MATVVRVYSPVTYSYSAVDVLREAAQGAAGVLGVQDPAYRIGRSPLKGKVIALVDNKKLLAFADAIEERLVAYGAASVVRYQSPTYQPAAEDVIDEIASVAAAAITGLGNCGSCTALTCQDGTRLTQRGVLAATLVIPQFHYVAAAAVSAAGVADHPVIFVREDVDFVRGAPLAAEAERVTRLFMGVDRVAAGQALAASGDGHE